MFNTLFKIFLASVIFIFGANSVLASSTVHPGTTCNAANQAQANLMTWTKSGLKNNSKLDLFVICPIFIDPMQWDTTPTLEVSVSMWMPPKYGPRFAKGPWCSARVVANNKEPGSSYDGNFDTIANKSFNVGEYNPVSEFNKLLDPIFSGDDSYVKTEIPISYFPSVNLGLDIFSANLLCLLPKNGGTIGRYYSNQK